MVFRVIALIEVMAPGRACARRSLIPADDDIKYTVSREIPVVEPVKSYITSRVVAEGPVPEDHPFFLHQNSTVLPILAS